MSNYQECAGIFLLLRHAIGECPQRGQINRLTVGSHGDDPRDRLPRRVIQTGSPAAAWSIKAPRVALASAKRTFTVMIFS